MTISPAQSTERFERPHDRQQKQRGNSCCFEEISVCLFFFLERGENHARSKCDNQLMSGKSDGLKSEREQSQTTVHVHSVSTL